MISVKNPLLYVLFLCLLTSCVQGKKQQETIETVSKKQPSISKIWESDTTLITPESVLYNPHDGLLYIACINGLPPTAKDGDGYIAVISTINGEIVNEKWITGLDAPKGMGILGQKLYVTNIDEVWEIDLNVPTILNKYAIEGANFLNDIDISPEGDIYISDSGTDKIHLLKNGTLSTLLYDSSFNRPNGLYVIDNDLMMATSGSGNFYKINRSTLNYEIVTDSIFGGDGVEPVGNDFLVSNWNGELYYVWSNGDKIKLLDTKGVANCADIEYLPKEETVIVPTFFGNQVVAYKLTFE